MKTKTFDCVEMMHQGARHVEELLNGKTPAEELAFWRERTEGLRKLQKQLRAKTRGQ